MPFDCDILYLMPTSVIEADVVVCGGGCAGLGAAITAAREGMDVLLLERAPFAGGIVSTVGLHYFDGVADARSDAIILRGLPIEFLRRLGVCGSDPQTLSDVDPNHAHFGHGAITIPNIERFKLEADRMLSEVSTHLRVLYHSMVCDVKTTGDRIEHVLVANKDGLTKVRCRYVIDATGDADVAVFAGEKVEKSEPLMPMTLHFRIAEVQSTPELRERVKAATVRAYEAGELACFYGPNFDFSFGPREINLHAVRVPGDASNAASLSQAEQQGRADAWAMFERWKREIPEFKDAYFLTSGPFIGVRETRRLVGQSVLHEKNILENQFSDDGVVSGSWYLDVHPNRVTLDSANDGKPYWPGPYDIAFGTFMPRTTSNLAVVGRCHSATKAAASSSRVTATCMAMGQAVGVAVTVARQGSRSLPELTGQVVRDALDARGLGPYRPDASNALRS